MRFFLARNKAYLWHYVLAVIFLLFFFISTEISFYYPIYGDEFLWKLISSRFVLDQKKLIYFFPACVTSFEVDTPITWIFGRFLDSLIYQGAHDYRVLRLIGVIQYIVLIIIIWRIMVLSTGLTATQAFLFVLAFLSMGVLPILLILNRPEQPLLIYISLSIYIPLLYKRYLWTILESRIFVTFLFCMLSNLIITTHPKGIYLLPIVLLSYRKLVKSPLFLTILFLVTSWTAIQTIQLWNGRMLCTESPWLEALLRSMTLNIGGFFLDPLEFIRQVFKNFARFHSYINQALFQFDYQSQWLPSVRPSAYTRYAIWILNVLCWATLLLLFAFVGLRRLKHGEEKKRLWESQAAALIVAIALLTGMQIGKNFYESALVMPLLLLLCISLIGDKDLTAKKVINRLGIPALLVVGAFSSYARYAFWSDQIPGWSGTTSVSVTEHKIRKDFAQMQCGIDYRSKRLILDTTTYTTFWDHRSPLFHEFVFGWYATGTDYRTTLASSKTEGLVAMCEGLPRGLRELSNESEGVCCISKSNLDEWVQKQITNPTITKN